MRFIDFIIFLCAITTAASTFAIAVELIVGWDAAWPMVEQVWDDSGLEKFLPPDSGTVNTGGEATDSQ